VEALPIAGHDLGQAIDRVDHRLGRFVQLALRPGTAQDQDTGRPPSGSVIEESNFLTPNKHPAPCHHLSPPSLAGDVERMRNMARWVTVNIGMFQPCVTSIREQSGSQ
jgi:hypothetical protein